MTLAISNLDLPLVVHDRVLVSLCLELVLYLERMETEAVMEFWTRSRSVLADRLSHYRAGTMRNPGPLSAKADRMVETWIARPRVGHLYSMEVYGSEQTCSEASLMLLLSARPEPRPPELMEQERARQRKIYEQVGCADTPPISVLRMTVPLDHSFADPDPFVEWVLALAPVARGEFVGGHAGLAVNFDDGVSLDSQRIPMTSKLAALLARHPGLDWDYPSAVLRHLLRYRPDTADFVPQIKRVNWLTLIPASTLAELGKRSEILGAFQPESNSDYPHVIELSGGAVLVRAQHSPALGDVTRGDHLPAYRKVAAVLEPMRLVEHPPLGGALDEERVEQWLEALDRPLHGA